MRAQNFLAQQSTTTNSSENLMVVPFIYKVNAFFYFNTNQGIRFYLGKTKTSQCAFGFQYLWG